MSPHYRLAVTYITLAVMQTAVPWGIQSTSHSVLYQIAFDAGALLCILTGVGVANVQFQRRCYRAGALVAFYLGLVPLIAWDLLVPSQLPIWQ